MNLSARFFFTSPDRIYKIEKGQQYIPTSRLLRSFLSWSPCFDSCPNIVTFLTATRMIFINLNQISCHFSLQTLQWLSITFKRKSEFLAVPCKSPNDLVYAHLSNFSLATLCLFCFGLISLLNPSYCCFR